jgi:pimeloyl-ACP methyl ester carboxylesterase
MSHAPIAPMAGVLHRYGPSPHQLAFVSPGVSSSPSSFPPSPRHPRLHVVLLSGLTEGLLALPYAPLLAEKCAELGCALVQAQLRSSYDGWGRASLDGDADELALLLAWLSGRGGGGGGGGDGGMGGGDGGVEAKEPSSQAEGVVLVGHSTGCQIVARYCERLGRREAAIKEEREEGGSGTVAEATPAPPPPPPPLPPLPSPRLLAVVLQASVSDREYFLAAWPPEVCEKRLQAARAAVSEGDPERVVAEVEGAPVCARRLLALLERLGDDDMFSRDLSPEEMRERTSVGWLLPREGATATAAETATETATATAAPESTAAPRWEVLVLASGADEYALPLLPEVAAGASSSSSAAAAEKHALIRAAAERVAAAAGPGARAETVEGAPHNGAGKEAEVVAAIARVLMPALADLCLEEMARGAGGAGAGAGAARGGV